MKIEPTIFIDFHSFIHSFIPDFEDQKQKTIQETKLAFSIRWIQHHLQQLTFQKLAPHFPDRLRIHYLKNLPGRTQMENANRSGSGSIFVFGHLHLKRSLLEDFATKLIHHVPSTLKCLEGLRSELVC
jgi:hypothetical protein